MKRKEIQNWLIDQAEPEYKKFASSLIPECENILGVRLPKLHKKAKEIIKTNYKEFISTPNNKYFEETMLQGITIGLLDTPLEELFTIIENFIPQITNWSICDTFCASLKQAQKHKDEFWNFLEIYLNSEKEFELRFAVVMLLNHFVTEEWIEKTINKLFTLNSDKYYAQMAIAWAISVCLAKNYDKTFIKLKNTKIHPAIFKKIIQKGRESYRLTIEQKRLLKELLNDR